MAIAVCRGVEGRITWQGGATRDLFSASDNEEDSTSTHASQIPSA